MSKLQEQAELPQRPKVYTYIREAGNRRLEYFEVHRMDGSDMPTENKSKHASNNGTNSVGSNDTLIHERLAMELSVPFDDHMERNSLFMPTYLSKLLSMVADREGIPKSKIIRNALLRELVSYLREVKNSDGNGGPLSPATPEDVMFDFEQDGRLVEDLYTQFAMSDENFQPRMRLRKVKTGS